MEGLFHTHQQQVVHLVHTMHQERIQQVLALDRTHSATITQLGNELASVRSTMAALTQKYLHAEDEAKKELTLLKSELQRKQSHIEEVESTHIQATKLIGHLSADIKHLKTTVDSARKWLKKPFYKTLFSKWKPPQRAES